MGFFFGSCFIPFFFFSSLQKPPCRKENWLLTELFSWVQNKLINGRQGSSKKTIYPPNNKDQGAQKEEFSDWPNGFLSIGTFGNKDLKEETKGNEQNSHVQSQNHTKDLTLEEVRELHKKLSALISSSSDHQNIIDERSENKSAHSSSSKAENKTNHQHFTSTIVPNKAKDVYLDHNTNSAISKKSLSFLLKKLFACGSSGLGPTPSLRDPILSPPVTRMEKILRAILEKKIHPQSPCQTMSKKRYLVSRQTLKSLSNCDDNDDDDDSDEGSDDGSKWVKTDTEYIVLEI